MEGKISIKHHHRLPKYQRQQCGTLNYNLGPIIFRDNGPSLSAIAFDKGQAFSYILERSPACTTESTES